MKVLWRRRAVLFGGVVFFLVPPFLVGGVVGLVLGATAARTSTVPGALRETPPCVSHSQGFDSGEQLVAADGALLHVEGHVVRYELQPSGEYAARGRAATIRPEGGGFVLTERDGGRKTFDRSGWVTGYVDAWGRETSLARDEAGRVVRSVVPLPAWGASGFTYDRGARAAPTDDQNRPQADRYTTTWTYAPLGRVVERRCGPAADDR